MHPPDNRYNHDHGKELKNLANERRRHRPEDPAKPPFAL